MIADLHRHFPTHLLGDNVPPSAVYDSVIGLILARHQLQDGRRRAGNRAHRGDDPRSDLDGFIQADDEQIEASEDLAKFEPPLRAAYPADADAIRSGNALRVVRRVLAPAALISAA